MLYNMKTIIGATAIFFTAVQGHISMATPKPFGKPDTSPLSPSGSNYPCKSDNGFTGPDNAPEGGKIKVSFSGTAVHGGGSCQIALAKSDKPDANTPFKVIHSFHGGCPGLDGSTVSYDIPVPSEVPAGKYTLAWTWFNRIGNREMYMNCASMTISGGGSGSFDSLPDLAIYNIQSKGSCKTIEGSDVQFPNPGKYVTTAPGFKPAPPSGSGCGGSGGSSAPAAAGASTGGATVSASTGSSSDASAGSSTGTFDDGKYRGEGSAAKASSGKGSAPASFAESSAPVSAPAAPAPVAAAPVAAAPKAASGSNSTVAAAPKSASGATTAPIAAAAAPAAGGACTDGQVVCSPDGSSFGLCNWGKVVFQPVASGTKCSNGQITKRHIFRS